MSRRFAIHFADILPGASPFSEVQNYFIQLVNKPIPRRGFQGRVPAGDFVGAGNPQA